MTITDTLASIKTQPGLRDDADINGQAGLATYVAAKIFGSAPLPPGLPDWLKDSIETQASFGQAHPGAADWTIGGGPLDDKSRAERKAEQDEQSFETINSMLEETQRREQERTQWAAQSHSFAGVQMTGAEWQELGGELHKDGDLRQWLISRLMKDGKTRKDAERKADEIADVADIMAKPESQRTDAERQKLERAEKDTEIGKYLKAANDKSRELSSTQSAPAREIASGNRGSSVDGGADELSGFASAPPASEHYREAATDIRQPDAFKPLAAPPTTQRAATAKVAASGFDL